MSRFGSRRPLPAIAHRPGAGAPPTLSPAVPGRGLSNDFWLLDDDYAHGAALFDGGFYWESHEVWEGLWRATSEAQLRSFLQALIQVAAALLHRRDGRLDGMRTVARRADRRLDELGTRLVAGVDLAALRRRLATAIADLGAPPPTLPRRVRSRDRPACATDRWVQRSYTEYREAEGCQVVTTPAYPDYHDGHALLLDDAPRPEELAAWLERCAPLVGPAARTRRALCWEDDGEPAAVSSDRDAVLVTRGAGAPPPLPEGLTLAPARGDRDWEALVGLSLSIGAESSTSAAIEDFYRWRVAAQRAAQSADDRWWLVWDGGALVGAAGLFAGPQVCRFQEVQTRSSHRGRGIASAVVGHALADGLRRFPGATAVIVADEGSQAQRLYERLGFAQVGVQHWIRRRG